MGTRDDSIGHRLRQLASGWSPTESSRREENRFSLTCSTPFPGSVGLTLAFEPHGIAPTMTMESGELDIEILERR